MTLSWYWSMPMTTAWSIGLRIMHEAASRVAYT